jgi:hypothetical protein
MGHGRTLEELVAAQRPRNNVPDPARSAATAAPADAAMTPVQRRVLSLQRSAGNAAVVQAIRRSVGARRRPTVQRDKAPAWVGNLQKEFKSLFPKEKLMQRVVIKDYSKLNQKLQGAPYGAWTQSATEIFVRDPANLPGGGTSSEKGVMHYVLQHEANHIRQFSTSKGPPKTWAKMLDFEIQAYTNDKKWLAANAATEIPDKDVRDQIIKGVDDSLQEALRLKKEAAREKQPDTFLWNELKAAELIPQDADKDPLQLYKQP